MKKQYLVVAVLSTLLLPNVCFTAEADVSGGVKLGARVVDDSDESAKYQEYRDLDDDILGKIWLDAFKGSYFFGLKGKNIGLDDQSYKLFGGKYGQFKYNFEYDETLHNYAFDAKTPYYGVGHDTLTYSGAVPAVANWTDFDFSVERKKYGGELEISLGSPFYFNIGVERQETNGVRPLVLGNFFPDAVEIPEPIDHTTDNFSIRAGYSSENYLVEIYGLLSSFDNENSYVSREDLSGFLPPDTMYFAGLAPDNDYEKLGLKFAWKHLPFNSALAAGASYSTLENDLKINPELLVANPAYTQTFSGDISYTNLSTTLSSRPAKGLNTKFYFRYLDKENDASAVSTNSDNTYEKFEYDKTNAGVEVGYRLPKKTKLTAGYDYADTNRNDRPEFAGTTDNSFSVNIRNSLLEFMSVKLQYQHLNRDYDTDSADLLNLDDPPDPNSDISVSDFDVNGKDMDEVKIGVEIYPTDNFDLGLEYTYTSNDYDTPDEAQPDGEIAGVRAREKDDRNAFYLDFLWRLPRQIRLSGFAGYEDREVESQIQNGASPYTQDVEDDFWTYGLTGKMPFLNNRLDLIVDWEYQKSDGESDFGIDSTLVDIGSVSDYTLQRLKAKVVYAFTDQMDIMIGYQYEKYKYKDFAYEGFMYDTTSLGIFPTLFFSGAYADPDYETNLGYVMVKYTF
jgi:MtrB/PioB family decaheme-associated outer membrane protein